MSDQDGLEAASRLTLHDPGRLWGITPASIYFALCDHADATDHHAGFHNQMEILRTNDERDAESVSQVLRSVAERLALITGNGEMTNLGLIVLTSDTPETLVQALALREFPNLRQAVQEFARIDDTHVERTEFESFFPQEDSIEKLLVGSLNFAEIYPDSIVVNRTAVEQLFGDRPDLSRNQIHWLTFAWATEGITDISDEQVLWELYTAVTDMEDGRVDPARIDPSRLLAHATPLSAQPYPTTDIRTAVEELREQYADEQDRLKSMLASFTLPTPGEVENPPVPEIEGRSETEIERLLDLLSVVNGSTSPVTLHPQFLLSEYNCDTYDLFQMFEQLEEVGVDASVASDDLIEVVSAPACNFNTDSKAEYLDFLLNYHHRLDARVKDLDRVTTDISADAGFKKAELLDDLDDRLISPLYFTYTLLNPERKGEEVMNQYVGDSEGLHLEKVKLERWQNEKPDNAKPYQEMLDRLLKKGLQEDLAQDVVRIMTPYDDDTFKEYTSTLRDLAREGYEIRLLTRYTRDKYLWDRLKENLLEPLGEERTNVTIRTYSRYKEHEYISQDEPPEYMEEFGIHGKLQTIGNADNGAVLLGSANFMENSFDWNPECGIYTENPILLEAAIAFFDFVWELAQADPVSFDQMKEVPDREFYPSYYLR